MGIMNSYTMEVGVTIIVISYTLLMCGHVEHGHHEQVGVTIIVISYSLLMCGRVEHGHHEQHGGGSHNYGHFLHSVNVWSCGTRAS